LRAINKGSSGDKTPVLFYAQKEVTMIRFLLSIIILTLLITYAIVPFVKYVIRFFKAEGKRINKSFEKDGEK
jgi:cytochrome c oxidase assembly protein Cox11